MGDGYSYETIGYGRRLVMGDDWLWETIGYGRRLLMADDCSREMSADDRWTELKPFNKVELIH